MGWALVIGGILYFIGANVLHYFVFTETSYGKYFWQRTHWLLPHIAGGLFAILIGPMQFWPGMRARHLGLHRVAGWVYVCAVLLGACAGLGLATTIPSPPAYAVGLAGLSIAWLTTTTMAFVAIRRRHIDQHRQWMIRSYVVTCAFVTFRLFDDALGSAKIMGDDDRASVLAWGCWAVPLLVAEVVMQARAVFSRTSA